jgi:hypothetical protein
MWRVQGARVASGKKMVVGHAGFSQDRKIRAGWPQFTPSDITGQQAIPGP